MRTIPIVFASVAQPVASGIVTRLDRLSGNITGLRACVEPAVWHNWKYGLNHRMLLVAVRSVRRTRTVCGPVEAHSNCRAGLGTYAVVKLAIGATMGSNVLAGIGAVD
jgi:hypothetical protein